MIGAESYMKRSSSHLNNLVRNDTTKRHPIVSDIVTSTITGVIEQENIKNNQQTT